MTSLLRPSRIHREKATSPRNLQPRAEKNFVIGADSIRSHHEPCGFGGRIAHRSSPTTAAAEMILIGIM